MRKIMAFLTASALLAASPLFASIVLKSEDVGGITWHYGEINGVAKICNILESAISTDTAGAISIPSTLGGCPVKIIGSGAFANCTKLTGVTIPNSVTNIEDNAFFGCTGLTSMTIPSSVRGLGVGAFQICTSLGSVKLSSNIASIEEKSFYGCSSLKSVAIPWGVTSIGKAAFQGCTSVTNVTIQDSVTEIGKRAFYYCNHLTGVEIPASVTQIGGEAFGYCERLASVTFYGYVSDVADTAFEHVNSAHSANCIAYVPSDRMGDFDENSNGVWKGLVLERMEPVYTIENGVLTHVDMKGNFLAYIPSSVTSIGDQAFYGRALVRVWIPDSVTNIGYQAFCWCSRLETVTIPASVTSIGSVAFVNCQKLAEVRFKGSQPSVGEGAFSGVSTNCRVLIPESKSTTYETVGNKWQGLIAYSYQDWVTVSFDANGGGEVAERTFDKDAKLGDLPTTTRTGYTFAGWHTAKSGGSKISASTTVMKDVTYYAHWTANKYTVKFDGNGATSGSMAAQARTCDDKNALTANAFKRTGYHFKGWATAKGGSVKYTDKQVANLSSTAGATVTLYAVWELSTYKVAFNANGGTGTMKALAVNVGAKKALTANAFKRTGYAFLGWAKKKGATKADYKDKASVKDLATKDGATVTLYAVWKANAYTVKFSANGGTGKMANLAMTYGKAKALTANAFKRTNFTFLGWSTSKTATKATYANKASVKNLKASGTVTLYAVWKRNAYSIAFNANGGTGTMKAQTANTAASVALSANAFKRAGYEFLGWSTSKTATKATYTNKQKVKDLAKTGKSVTLYAVWSLPAWTKGTFYGDCDCGTHEGVVTVKITSLGKLTGTMTWNGGKNKPIVRTFSASNPKWTASYAKKQFAADFDLDDDGPTVANGSCWTYAGVKVVTPAGKTVKMDVRVANCTVYKGTVRTGAIAFTDGGDLEGGLSQDVWTNTAIKELPAFAAKTSKTLAVKSVGHDQKALYKAGVRKLTFAFAAKGAVTVTALDAKGKALDSYAAHLLVDGVKGKKFLCWTPVYFKKLGCLAWFGVDVKEKSGAVQAGDITLGFDD